MSIAVVIPTYNRAALIIEALDSVLAQTTPPDRVIVVDDGSTDATGEVLATWLRDRHPGFRVECIRQENQGVSAARNRGILAVVDCTYIAFLDSDDRWPSTHLATAARMLADQPDAVAYAGQSVEAFEDADGRVVSQRLVSVPPPRALVGAAALGCSMPHTSTSVIRRDVLVRCGLFDTGLRYAEDKLLFLKVSTQGDWIRHASEPVYYRNKLKSIASGQLSSRPDEKSRILFSRRLEKTMASLRREPDTKYTDGIDLVVWKSLHRTGRTYQRRRNYRVALAYYRHALRYRVVGKTLGRLVECCLARAVGR